MDNMNLTTTKVCASTKTQKGDLYLKPHRFSEGKWYRPFQLVIEILELQTHYSMSIKILKTLVMSDAPPNISYKSIFI